MNDRFFRSFCSGLMAPRRKKINRRKGVFHGFIGVIAFIAYALPLILVTSVFDYATFVCGKQESGADLLQATRNLQTFARRPGKNLSPEAQVCTFFIPR